LNGPVLDKVTEMRHVMREDLGVGRSFVPTRQHVAYDVRAE